MRKIIRNMLRGKAEKMSVKPSRYVRSEFNRLQTKKYGETVRKINRAKGTHSRRTWRIRIASVLD